MFKYLQRTSFITALFSISLFVILLSYIFLFSSNILARPYDTVTGGLEMIATLLFWGVFFSSLIIFIKTPTNEGLFYSAGIFGACLFDFFRNNGFFLFYSKNTAGVSASIVLTMMSGFIIYTLGLFLSCYHSQDDKKYQCSTKTVFLVFGMATIASFFLYFFMGVLLPIALANAGNITMMQKLSFAYFMFFSIAAVSVVIYAVWLYIETRKEMFLWKLASIIFIGISAYYLLEFMQDVNALANAYVFKIIALGAIMLEARHYFSVTEHIVVEKLIREKTAAMSRKTEMLREKSIESTEVSRTKSELLANMSHELRTPMNAIIGFTSRVIKKTEGAIPERQQENLKKIQRNAYHLLSLINTILDISKVESGRMEVFCEKFQLEPLINEVIEMASSLLGDKEINLAHEGAEEIILNSDRTKIKQMLVNLIGNSIKFTESGEIKIHVTKKENIEKSRNAKPKEGIEISVSDTGIGIKEENLPYIFDDYKQVDNSLTRKTGGTGLGLSIVKKFSLLLGGNVDVESEYERGTTFHIRLPYDSSNFKYQEEEDPQAQAVRAGKAVICYSVDPEISEYVKKILQEQEIETIMTKNVNDTFSQAKSAYPRVIVLDLLSPKKNSLDVLRKLRSNYYTRDIPILSAAVYANQKFGYYLNILDFIYKPLKKEQIGAVMDKTIRFYPHIKNIMLIDHDESSLGHMHSLITSEGEDYRARVATTEAEAVALMQKKQDLIFVNLTMPNAEAFKILSYIGNNAKIAATPIVLTGTRGVEKSEIDFINGEISLIPLKGGVKISLIYKGIKQIMEVCT